MSTQAPGTDESIEELAGLHREVHAAEGETLLADKGSDGQVRRADGAGLGDVRASAAARSSA